MKTHPQSDLKWCLAGKGTKEDVLIPECQVRENLLTLTFSLAK